MMWWRVLFDVCLLMLMMVEDGPGVDGVQIVSTVEDVWLEVHMYVNLVCPPAVKHVKKSAEPPVT